MSTFFHVDGEVVFRISRSDNASLCCMVLLFNIAIRLSIKSRIVIIFTSVHSCMLGETGQRPAYAFQKCHLWCIGILKRGLKTTFSMYSSGLEGEVTKRVRS